MDAIDPKWTVNSISVRSIVQAVNALGGDSEAMLREAGIDAELLVEAEARHSVAAMHRLYQLAAASCGDDIGIYAGRVDYISRLNMQLYTCGVCETFRDYLNLMPSVLHFAGDIGEVRIRRDDERLRLDWLPLWQDSSRWRFHSDCLLTTSANIVRSLCVRPIPMLRADFSYPEPDDTALLESVFACELHFSQPRSSLYFDSASLDYRLVQLDAEWSMAIRQSTQHLFGEGEPDPMLRALRNTLIKMLPAGGVTIDKTAQAQNISRRTLQRRLADSGTQFGQLLQELRAELALQYLADERLSITDIALLLGYADHGSFSSAFKSWFGRSPREYRRA